MTQRREAHCLPDLRKPAVHEHRMHGKKEFVLSFPEEVMPAEIVKRGRLEGFTGLMEIDPEYASTTRSNARKAGTWPTKGANGGRAKSAPAVRGDAEAEFRRAARGITLDRAKEILDEIGAAYDG
jgi:hypothetical protein